MTLYAVVSSQAVVPVESAAEAEDLRRGSEQVARELLHRAAIEAGVEIVGPVAYLGASVLLWEGP